MAISDTFRGFINSLGRNFVTNQQQLDELIPLDSAKTDPQKRIYEEGTFASVDAMFMPKRLAEGSTDRLINNLSPNGAGLTKQMLDVDPDFFSPENAERRRQFYSKMLEDMQPLTVDEIDQRAADIENAGRFPMNNSWSRVVIAEPELNAITPELAAFARQQVQSARLLAKTEPQPEDTKRTQEAAALGQNNQLQQTHAADFKPMAPLLNEQEAVRQVAQAEEHARMVEEQKKLQERDPLAAAVAGLKQLNMTDVTGHDPESQANLLGNIITSTQRTR